MRKLPRKIFSKGNASLRILNDGRFVLYNNDKEVERNYSFSLIKSLFCNLIDRDNFHLCTAPSNKGSDKCDYCWLGCGYIC